MRSRINREFSRWVAGWAVLAFFLTGLVPPPAIAMRVQAVSQSTGMEELRARLVPEPTRSAPAGLEEPRFRGLETLQPIEAEQLARDLFAGGLTLDQLNRYLPEVMRKVRGDAAAPSGGAVPQVLLEDYSTVQTADITRKGLSEPMLQRGLAKMGKTAALIQVGGGGTRFDGGVPKEFREQWAGQGRKMLSKPTAANGILELATLIQILQSLNAVAAEARIVLPVFLNESGDTREQIIQWFRFVREKRGLDFPHLEIYLTDQLEHPTFDAETGEILWQVNASGHPELRTMGAGTLGGVIAMDGKVRDAEGNLQGETPDDLTREKEHFLVIYADDPVLHDREFILGLLAAGEDADIVPVGLPRRPKMDSNGGVQFFPPGGRLVTAHGITRIVELSDSIPGSDKVPHPNLNAFEDAVYRQTGRGLTFNVGSLYLSRKGLEAYRTLYREGKFPPNVTEKKFLRLSERTGAGAVSSNLRMAYLVELYLTDGAELAAAEFPDLRVKVAEVDGWRYQAAKDFGRMKQAETILLELGQEQLLELGGEIADTSRVQFAPEWDDPTFGGLLGTRIHVAGNLGVVFTADRVLVRRLHLSSFTIEMEATEDEKTVEGRRKKAFEARVTGLQQSLLDARGFSEDPKRPGLLESLLEPAGEGKVLGLLGVPLGRSKLHDPSLVRKVQPSVFNRDTDPDQAVIQVALLHPQGDPVELFKARPGQQVVVPPGTVIDERVFDPAYVVQSGMAFSPRASTDLEGISRVLVAQQEAAGLFTSVLGTPEKVLGDDRYLLINRPDTVSSMKSAAAASTQRPDPLGVPQWKPAEQGYRWRTSILKANRAPRQEGDVVLSVLRQRPQGMTESMLRDLVVFTGGDEKDPAIAEAIWLLAELDRSKAKLSMKGINLAVQGPGLMRGFYNDAGVGASIPEHAHSQATPHPMKAEREALDPIARVGNVTFSFIQGWAGPIFVVQSDRMTIYVAPRLVLSPPPVTQNLDGYLAKDRAQRDQSGEYLMGAAAREMLGTMIAMDDSTFDRLTVEAADQIVAGALVPRESLEPVVQAIRSRAPATGLEEDLVDSIVERLEKGDAWVKSGALQELETLISWDSLPSEVVGRAGELLHALQFDYEEWDMAHSEDIGFQVSQDAKRFRLRFQEALFRNGFYLLSVPAIFALHPEWVKTPPERAKLQSFAQTLSWLPPIGGKVPVVLDEHGTPSEPAWSLLSPTWTAEEQVEEVLRLRQQGELGAGYVHQMTVQGRLPDEFKYVALALILASPYRNDWSQPFFEAPWGKVAPLVHDGGNVDVGLNPLWKKVEGRTDFLQRVAKVHLKDLEVLEGLPESEQIERRGDLEPAESEAYERARLLLEVRAYQRLALALHAKMGTASPEIPPEIQAKFKQHWIDFESKMRALLGEFGLKGVAEVPWFTEEAKVLSNWPGPRYEAPWEPIQKELIHLEKVRQEYPQPLFNRANQILQKVTDAIDRDLGLAAAGLEEFTDPSMSNQVANRLVSLGRLERLAKIVEHPEQYIPGVARLSERKEEVRSRIINSIKGEVFGIYEAKISDPVELQRAKNQFERLLLDPATMELTNEELFRVAFLRILDLAGGKDPFWAEKNTPNLMKVRQWANGLLDSAGAVDVKDRAAVGNLLDELSLKATQLNFLDPQSKKSRDVYEAPHFFDDFDTNISKAVGSPEIDGRPEWKSLVLDTDQGTFLYLVDNVGEADADAALWLLLARLGHDVVIGAKSSAARGDATVEDVRQIIDARPLLGDLEKRGHIRLIDTGSRTYGTPLDQASDELIAELTNPALRAVVMKGQGNLYTTVTRNSMKVPVALLLLSKGVDAAEVTGVSDPALAVPVIAVIPAGRHIRDPVPGSPGEFRGSLKEGLRGGLEEVGSGTRALLRGGVSGPVVMDVNGIPQTVFRHRISVSAAIPAVVPGSRLLLAQEGVLPSAVMAQFAARGWAVETLPAKVTPGQLAGRVQAGLKEWSGSMLVVAATGMEEAVGLLPVEARLTTVFVDPAMVSSMAPNVLLAYLVQALESFPGGIRRLEFFTQTGMEEFEAVSSQL